DGISLQIPGGQVYGLIGRNGAGKTTLLRAIAQQLNSSGTVTLDGQTIRDNEWALERIILAGPDATWPQDLPVRSVLRVAELRWPTWDQAFAEEMIQAFRIDTSKRLRAMSRGQRSAVSIILGLAAQCPITLLDEPYLGLDVQSREAFYQVLMSDLERNPRTVILSTHHLGDVARLLDQVIIIDEGKLLESGPSRRSPAVSTWSPVPARQCPPSSSSGLLPCPSPLLPSLLRTSPAPVCAGCPSAMIPNRRKPWRQSRQRNAPVSS